MNQRVLITGASHGIGKAAAERFAKEGCILILNCRQSVEELSALEFYLKKNSFFCILSFLFSPYIVSFKVFLSMLLQAVMLSLASIVFFSLFFFLL